MVAAKRQVLSVYDQRTRDRPAGSTTSVTGLILLMIERNVVWRFALACLGHAAHSESM